MVKFLRKKLSRCRRKRHFMHGECCPVCTLCDIKPGKRARIRCHKCNGAIRNRLFAMGLVPDVMVDVVKTAPMGDPIELKLEDGSLPFTLSKSEASAIEVVPEQNS